jgi:MFS transporter, ACS family, D-galactonate transporter
MSITQNEHRATKVRWLIVVMLMGFTFLGHFNRVSISVAGNERFTGPDGMGYEQMGFVYSAFLLVYTICMLPGGWVIDRLGPRLALTGMALGMGLCVMLTGALGWLGLAIASLWLPLLVIRGLAGLVSVPLHPGAARSVSLWLPLANRSTANGLVTAGALVGIALTYPGFGLLMDSLDWPMAFVVSGATMMLFALAWCWLATDEPAAHPWVNAAERNLIHGDGRPAPRSSAGIIEVLGMIRNRGLVLLTLSYAALSYFQYLFFYWIEHYFEKELQLPVSESRRAAFTVTMAMALGMAFGGWGTDSLCHKLGRRWGCRVMAMVGMGLSAWFGWLGVSASDPTQVVWLFSLALGALGLVEGIFWTSAPILEPRSGGLACAFLNTVGNAGGLLAPVFTPMIGARYGWTAAIVVACLVCGVGALMWLVIDTEGTSQVQ